MISRIVSTRGFRFAVFQNAVFVFLADESLHCGVGFVDVDGDVGFDVAWVVLFVDDCVSPFLHVLYGQISVRPAMHLLTRLFLTSTCSVVQLSIVNDLTFEICVPIFR